MPVMAGTNRKTRASREVTISRPDKQLWPDLGFTKQDYADYLRAVEAYFFKQSLGIAH